MPQTVRRATATVPIAALLIAATISACGGKDTKTETTTAKTDTAPPAAAPSMGNMAMTGDADRDFLRMMADHHKALIHMSHETMESKEKLGVKDLAKRLDTEQDASIEKIIDMLESAFKDAYTPSISPNDQAMIDQLTGKTGAEYDRIFLENVIKHHERGVGMIDAYLPHAKVAAVRTMAENMKAAQQTEISEFQKKAGK